MDDHTHASCIHLVKKVRVEERIYSKLDWKEIERKTTKK
jgi:7-keto-8-aminopelargonate synthetase-like enzyme